MSNAARNSMALSNRFGTILSFVAVVDSGSFAAAARSLGISSAAVSKNLGVLEELLGVRLMNRSTRTISLTDEGKAFLKQARVAIEALDTAVDNLAEQRSDNSGHVRISTSAAFGADHLIPVLSGLMAKCPSLTVEVDLDDRVIDLVKDGYDLAIRGGHIPDSTLVARPICRINVMLVAAPSYIERAGIPKSAEDLIHHRLILHRFLGGRIRPWGFKASDGSLSTLIINSPALTLSASESLAEAASLGLGIAQVPVHLAWKYLLDGRLKPVLLGLHDLGNYEVSMVYHHRALMAPRVRVTVEYLLERFAKDEALHVPLTALNAFQI